MNDPNESYETRAREAIARLSKPLAPKPTKVEPRLTKLTGIRAVVLDVYGTMLISGSGDISITSGAARGDAAAAAIEAVGFKCRDGDAVVQTLLDRIQTGHAESEAEHPEVDIVDIWADTLVACFEKRWVVNADGQYDDIYLPVLVTEYECRVNPIWLMPGLQETLDALRESGRPLGIVSNAQFFTPLAIEQLTGHTLGDLGFDENLEIYSYRFLQAKPGVVLYELAAGRLAEQGIEPHETLYVGNDMLNDIWPAREVGFRTALFAGDARSLRLREDDKRMAGVEPDVVVTELIQLLDCLT